MTAFTVLLPLILCIDELSIHFIIHIVFTFNCLLFTFYFYAKHFYISQARSNCSSKNWNASPNKMVKIVKLAEGWGFKLVLNNQLSFIIHRE